MAYQKYVFLVALERKLLQGFCMKSHIEEGLMKKQSRHLINRALKSPEKMMPEQHAFLLEKHCHLSNGRPMIRESSHGIDIVGPSCKTRLSTPKEFHLTPAQT